MAKSTAPIRTVELPCGAAVPALGQGTWNMAEDPRLRRDELKSLRYGLDLGMTLIDTAEMYADGGAERLVAEAIEGRRDQVFLVSKVLPHNATRKGTIEACERSLKRLATDRLDLYLLHWRESKPLSATLEAFDALIDMGKICSWGVSNFDLSDMKELTTLSRGNSVQTDQVLYNLVRRGIEWDLMPWCRARSLPIMAYSPIEQGRLLSDPALKRVARHHRATAAQVALAWVLRHDDVIAIPKAGTPVHVEENRAALEIRLGDEDFTLLDRSFARPSGPQALEML